MNINEVPQDASSYKDKDKVRKLVYAVGKDGNYTGVNSGGWEPENTATEQAWEVIDESLKDVLQQVKDGKLSPIAYYMHKNLMDMALLAKYMGKWQWQVKRHLEVGNFKRLSPEIIGKYAAVFNIPVTDLTSFNIQ